MIVSDDDDDTFTRASKSKMANIFLKTGTHRLNQKLFKRA